MELTARSTFCRHTSDAVWLRRRRLRLEFSSKLHVLVDAPVSTANSIPAAWRPPDVIVVMTYYSHLSCTSSSSSSAAAALHSFLHRHHHAIVERIRNGAVITFLPFSTRDLRTDPGLSPMETTGTTVTETN